MEIITPTDLPPAPISEPMPYSGHLDRARGFTLATAPLAAATGLVVLLIAVTAFGVPVLSVMALLLALGGFAGTWLAALIAYQMISVEGALFYHVVMTWRLLFLESRERRKRYGNRK
jgi:hypothetical protein